MRTVRLPSELQTGPASRTAVTRLTRQGIDPLAWTRQPSKEPPRIPRNLPEVQDPELMGLFQQISEWVKFLRLQLAMAEVDESDAEHRMNSQEALARARSGGKTVTEMKALAREDGSFAAAAETHAAAYGYRKLVSALFENLDYDRFLLSREITRRGNEAPMDGRRFRR